jgi:PBP1b-binding outer membrane lipoprotein LpoB
MKKLLLILTTVLLFSACDNTPIKVENKQKVTTVELQQLAKIDTNLYKVVISNDKLYYINPKTELVEGVVSNESGVVSTLAVILIFMICLGGILSAILSN